MHSIDISARAKINLSLEVFGKRPDGYHELRSVVMPVSLADEIKIEEADALEIKAAFAPGFPREEATDELLGVLESPRNIMWKAAELMAERAGREPRVRISVLKRIPAGGGLGGGSADAAAVIRGLNSLWDMRFSREELADIAAGVGSDVPALAYGGAVVMEGRGEKVRPLFEEGNSIPEMWIVLANPGVNVPTGRIFAHFSEKSGEKCLKSASNAILNLTDRGEILDNIRLLVKTGQVEALAAASVNDLAESAYACFPEIRSVADALEEAGALGVQVSGSGASVFGFVRSQPHGARVLKKMGGVWSALLRICPIV